MLSQEQMSSEKFIMSAEHINSIVKIFYQMGQSMHHPLFYCELHPFKNKVSWEDRCYLRKRLVITLKSYYKKYKNQLFKNQTSKVCYKKWDRLLSPASSLQNSIAAVSVSHCPLLGGFVFSLNSNISIGLDMEIAARVSRKLVQRVSHLEEITKAPDNALLWTAKEAACKCISLNQRTVLLKDCVISHWMKVDKIIHHFAFKGIANAFQEENKSFCQLHRQSIYGIGRAFHFGPFAFSYAQLLHHH